MTADLRQALRVVSRTPSFAAAAVSVLALGIGASTAILGIVNPLTLAAVAGALALVALMAGLVPAYRAIRLDPAIVLRAE